MRKQLAFIALASIIVTATGLTVLRLADARTREVGGTAEIEPWAARGTEFTEADEDTYAFVAALVSEQPTAAMLERLDDDRDFVERTAVTVGRVTDTQIVVSDDFSADRRFEIHHGDETICGQILTRTPGALSYTATPCERPRPGASSEK